jgi:hypothetical protein
MESNTNLHVDKLITFGQMALEQGWYDQAREYFEQALGLDASNREAMKGLARAYERLSLRVATPVEPIQAEPVKPIEDRPVEPAAKVEQERSSPKKQIAEQKKNINITPALILLLVFALGILVATQVGFYSIQPIGAVPEGATWLVWRASDEPFFHSADSLCLKRIGSVSLLCRGLALAQAPKDRIILRLPYWEFAYFLSTGGKKFQR